MDPSTLSNDHLEPRSDAVAGSLSEGNPAPPPIPDHRLLRCIGRGSYGTVWLAQNTLGMYRAVKIVYRKSFKDERPFERELAGIRKFEPISRSHEGFVHVLHVGINQEQGYFYYVMELGDDQTFEQKINPEAYIPRTLGKDISLRGNLPLQECLQLGLALSLALSELHKRGLVHRDVKPSNIIFVNGVPKLADIGLVAEANEARSYVGTEGFIPPEGPGSAQADVYSLGKVLYEACTGKDRQDFPELPTQLDKLADHERLLELNEVILHACKNDIAKRYQSAWDLHADLLVVVNGNSVRRLRVLEQRLIRLKRLAGISSLVAVVLVVILYQIYRGWRSEMDARQRQVGENIAYGNRAVESGDLLGALPYFVEALRLDRENPTQEAAHRLLFSSTLAQCPKLNQMWFAGGEVRDGGFSRDGTEIIIPEFEGPTRIYDIGSGALRGHAFSEGVLVGGAALSPDGRLGVTASEQNMAYLWDTLSFKAVYRLPHPAPVRSARFSPDGLWVATAGQDGYVRLWNTRTGQLEHSYKCHGKGIRFVDFSPDGQLLITASEDDSAGIWNAGTGLPVGQPLLHGSWVNYAAFSPDGKMVVTACADHKARLWDVATGRRILVDLDHKDGVHSAQFSPDGRMVVTASLDGTARVWRLDSLQSGDSTLILRHSAGVVRASFSPDGHHIVTTCTDGSVRIWDLAGSVVAPVSERMVASEDGSRILTLTSNRVQVTDAVSGTVISSIFPANSLPSKIILSRNGHFGLGISDLQSNTNPPAHFLQVWDMTTGTAVAPGLFISNSLAGAVPSDDGKRLLVYGGGTVQAWDVIAQTNMSPRLMFEEPVTAAIFTPDGKQMAILSGKSLQLRDASGQLVFAPLLHSRPVVYASFSPNGSRLVTCCSDDQIHKCCATIWDTATGRVGPEFWHNDGVLFAAFDPEGKRVVTASEDYTARIWDAATGKQLTPDLQHAYRVKSAVFSPDGKWVVTACGDKTVRVWSATTGDPLTPPLRHLTSLASAQFLGDGHRVIASDQEGNSWIWDLKLDSRPEGDVRKIAGLLSGEPLGVPNDSSSRRPESFESLWRELRSKYPASFLTSPGETATWDEYEAEESENEKQWFAAAFHLRQLLSVDPSSQSLGARLANAEQHLKSEN